MPESYRSKPPIFFSFYAKKVRIGLIRFRHARLIKQGNCNLLNVKELRRFSFFTTTNTLDNSGVDHSMSVFLFFANSPSNRGLRKEYCPQEFSRENLFSRLLRAIWRQRRPKFSVFFLPRPHGLREPAQISQKQPRFQNQRISPFSDFCQAKKVFDLKIT